MPSTSIFNGLSNKFLGCDAPTFQLMNRATLAIPLLCLNLHPLFHGILHSPPSFRPLTFLQASFSLQIPFLGSLAFAEAGLSLEAFRAQNPLAWLWLLHDMLAPGLVQGKSYTKITCDSNVKIEMEQRLG